MAENSSKLLINEPPLQVLPTLAAHIGLNEAIILQQIQYHLNSPNFGEMHEGRKWVYNTVEDWQKEFPFWGKNTIRRILASLEKQTLILVGCFNKKPTDRTRWYTIDYEMLSILDSCTASDLSKSENQTAPDLPKMGNSIAQNGQMQLPKVGNSLPENTTETPAEIPDSESLSLRSSDSRATPPSTETITPIAPSSKESESPATTPPPPNPVPATPPPALLWDGKHRIPPSVTTDLLIDGKTWRPLGQVWDIHHTGEEQLAKTLGRSGYYVTDRARKLVFIPHFKTLRDAVTSGLYYALEGSAGACSFEVLRSSCGEYVIMRLVVAAAPKMKKPRVPQPRDCVSDAVAQGMYNAPNAKGDGHTSIIANGVISMQFGEEGKPTPEQLKVLADEIAAVYATWPPDKKAYRPGKAGTLWSALVEYRTKKGGKSYGSTVLVGQPNYAECPADYFRRR